MPQTHALLFRDLAARIYRADEPTQIYRAIVDAATDIVDGCDHASLMIVSSGAVRTAAASDEIAQLVDDYEKASGEGPCLDAITDELPHLDTDIETDSAWPRLSAHVVEQTPVRGMLGFRLLVDGRKAGALNVFSDTPGALTERSIDQATVLAAFASVALMAGSARQQATDLQTALHSNREIGKAVGLLMAAHKVPQERAFEILDRTSQELNIKLAEVAKRVVQGQEQQFRRGS
ncbi:MAG TPA: GAF and ANTAR domain-containing protein [Dermatophilaceae bacterium]|nr:GAF and ANTAR domain-containing protein [Dermatophilaceae bacterium]